MDKKEYYADKIYEIIKQAKQDNIRICTYVAGSEDIKDIGIAILEDSDDATEMIIIQV